MPSPMRMSGTARTRVLDVNASQEPKAPSQSAPSPAAASKPAASSPSEENRQAQGHRRNRPTQRPHASLSARSIMAPISDRDAPEAARRSFPALRTITRSAR